MSNENIQRIKNEILAGGPSLQEMAKFAMRDHGLEHVMRQVNAIDEAVKAGIFPVRVGNFIAKDKDMLVFSRRSSPYANPSPPSEHGGICL